MDNTTKTTTTLRLPAQALQEPVVDKAIEASLALAQEHMNQLEDKAEKLADTKEAPVAEVVAQSQGIDYPTYEAGRLNQVILHDGTVLKPVDGIYTATTEEAFDMLNYYAEQDRGLVTKLF